MILMRQAMFIICTVFDEVDAKIFSFLSLSLIPFLFCIESICFDFHRFDEEICRSELKSARKKEKKDGRVSRLGVLMYLYAQINDHAKKSVKKERGRERKDAWSLFDSMA